MNELMLEKQTQYYLPSDSGWFHGAEKGHYGWSGMTWWIPVSEMCGKILKLPSVCLDAGRISGGEGGAAGAAYIER